MNVSASWPIPHKALADIYPRDIGGLLVAAFEEVLGKPQFAAVIRQAGLAAEEGRTPDLPFDAPARVRQALEDAYGEQSARGICLRTGRVMFRRGLRVFSETLGLSHRSFRLLPPALKVLRGLDLLAWLLNHYSDQRVRVEKRGGELLLINERCPHCAGLTKPSPCCQLPVGALQAGLAWACSGRHYSVEETTCRAAGDPVCTYLIAGRFSS
jgi:predicted hydrocarbon binding protein